MLVAEREEDVENNLNILDEVMAKWSMKYLCIIKATISAGVVCRPSVAIWSLSSVVGDWYTQLEVRGPVSNL